MTAADRHTRVLKLVTRMNIGGPARHILAVAKGLPREVDLTVATGHAPVVEGELSDPQVPVRRLPLVRHISPRNDAAALRQTRALIRELEPTVLHTHMAKAGTVGRLAVGSMRRQVRTMHTFHGHVLAGYFNPSLERAFLEAERFLARRTDVLVAVSPEIRDALLDLGVGRPSQYEVVPLGLDLAGFDDPAPGRLRAAIGIGPDVALAGVVARLVPIKDHATLFEAVAAVDGLHLAVIGDGDCRNDLEVLANDLGVAGRIHFTGWWHDIPAALVDLDIAVLTSRNEGTPVALMEAAACGLPIVATDVGGVATLVEDGRNGLLAQAGDAVSIADHLRTLMAQPALRDRLGRHGRELAVRFARDNDPACQLAEIYASLNGG